MFYLLGSGALTLPLAQGGHAGVDAKQRTFRRGDSRQGEGLWLSNSPKRV